MEEENHPEARNLKDNLKDVVWIKPNGRQAQKMDLSFIYGEQRNFAIG